MSDFRVQPEDVALWYTKKARLPHKLVADRINTWAEYDADYGAIQVKFGKQAAKEIRQSAYTHQKNLPAHLRPDSWGNAPRGAKKIRADRAKKATKATEAQAKLAAEIHASGHATPQGPGPTAQEIVQAYHDHVANLETTIHEQSTKITTLEEELESLKGTNESVDALRKAVGR